PRWYGIGERSSGRRAQAGGDPPRTWRTSALAQRLDRPGIWPAAGSLGAIGAPGDPQSGTHRRPQQVLEHPDPDGHSLLLLHSWEKSPHANSPAKHLVLPSAV